MISIKSEITFRGLAVFTLALCLSLVFELATGQHQRVDYQILCSLDDQQHILTAKMKITYHNLSGNSLAELKFHTWMNVFNSKKSEFASQLARLGDPRKYKLKKEDQGGFTALNFSINNERLSYKFENESKEFLSIALRESLPHGDSVTISCDFILDIPKNISRGGHLNRSYQMTQWYPKVALLDTSGWNTMPYLEIGEYYNDFGNYEVAISLPDDYKVAGTGTLLNINEKEKLISSAIRFRDSNVTLSPNKFELSKGFKTIEFKAKNVTDFAWFADREFLVGHDTAIVNNNAIEIWSFYKSQKHTVWKSATDYSKRAIKYLSGKIGAYPYPQITLVECERPTLDAMEYPMISLIDQGYTSTLLDFEKVIVHEIAHNWFQAIVASNERKEAWLDEGLVSYFEKEYFRGRHLPNFLSDAPVPLFTDYDKIDDFPWYLQARENKDISASAPIRNFSLLGYIQSIYEKPAKGLRLMNKAVGDSIFKYRINTFYENWKFAHPTGKDFFNQLDIDSIWFKYLYISNSRKVDLKISLENKNLIISHNQDFSIPIELQAFKKGLKTWSKVKYIFKSDTIILEPSEQEYIIGDPNFLLPEINRINNIVRTRATPFAASKSKLHILPGIGHSLTRDRYIHPMMGFNVHDRFFMGLALHNFTLPAPFTLAGMILGYSFKSGRPVLQSGLSHTFLMQNSFISSITPQFEYRTFSDGGQTADIQNHYYHKISSKVNFNISVQSQLTAEKNISYRTIFINQIKKFRTSRKLSEKYLVHEIQYSDINNKHLFPHQWRSSLEFNSNYINLNTNYQIDIPYKYGNKTYGEIRLFAGIQNNLNTKFNSSFSISGIASNNGIGNDYKYDELLFGRSSFNSSLNQQIFIKDAGFYTSSIAGWSDSWLVAVTFRSKVLDLLPIRPYVQFALAPDNKELHSYFASGLSFVILKRMIEINFPVIESRSIKRGYSEYQQNSYLNKCTFLIDLKNLNPMKWLSALAK